MIDLCIALNGPHVGAMLPFFMDSLRKTSPMDQVRIHFVEKGCSDRVVAYLESIQSDTVVVHRMAGTYKEHNVALRDDGAIEHIVADCAGTCSWMVEHCGDSPWCFISHFDIELLKDLIGWYIEKCGPLDQGMGQVGSHMTGLVGYRRLALKQIGVNFSAISGFCLVKDDRNVWVLRHRGDGRCSNHDLPVHGFDVGELVELNLAAKGWGIFSPTMEELNKWRCHLGTGSGHCGDQRAKRNEALRILQRRGLHPIE